MGTVIYLDTHVVAWLYAGRTDLLPSLAKALIEGNELLLAPIVTLELQFLYETKRTAEPAARVIDALAVEIGLQLCDLPFADVARAAANESWTRDPFDRILVAQARFRGEPLLTKDREIRRRYEAAVWDRHRGAIGE
ncbi:MAG TPA: PIN domain-containing protein [Thermoanaerobaculia bacterium]|nr:PIN domain-containing protein [Thermoanaerobaculia bacterium]